MQAVRSATARAVCVLLLLVLSLPACGSGGGEEAQSGGEDKSAKEEMKLEEKEKAKDEVPPEPAPKAGGEPMPKAGKQLPPEQKSAVAEAGIPEGQDFDRRVINTAELGIRAEDVRDSAARARQIAVQFGGSVLSSELNQGEGSVSADLVLSIPSERFEEALDELRELGGEVTTDTIEGEDVTEEFVDLEARERNLLAAEQSLVELYDQAESVDDTLAIQRELTQIRGQIERVQGRIEYLEQRTDFSQVTLSIQPLAGAADSRPAWDPAGIVTRAWNASLSVLQALATAVISIVVFGWWLAPILVVGLVWWWRRRNRKASSPAETDSTREPR